MSYRITNKDNMTTVENFFGLEWIDENNIAPDQTAHVTARAQLSNLYASIAPIYLEENAPYRYLNNVAPTSAGFIGMHWLKLLHDIIGNGEKIIKTRTSRQSFTGDEIPHITRKFTDYVSITNPTPGNVTLFRFLEINRGAGAVNKIRDNTIAATGLNFDEGTSMAIQLDGRHRVFFFQNHRDNTYDIITSRPVPTLWPKLLPAMVTILPELHCVGEANYEDQTPAGAMKRFCKMIYEGDTNAYLTYLQNFIREGEQLRNQQLYNSLDRIQNEFNNETISRIDREISRAQNNVEGRITSLDEALATLTALQEQQTLLMLNKDKVNEQIKTLFDFIKKETKIFNLIEVNPGDAILTIDIKTPILNFRRKDGEMWFRRTERNYVNRDAKVAAVFKACFVDETHDMLTTTRVRLYLKPTNSSSAARGINRWGQGLTDALQNEHIGHYDCFSTYKAEIMRSIVAQDYYKAALLLIQACSTYTLTDSSVVCAMTANMAECTAQCYQDKITKELYTLNELYEKLSTPVTTESEPNSEPARPRRGRPTTEEPTTTPDLLF